MPTSSIRRTSRCAVSGSSVLRPAVTSAVAVACAASASSAGSAPPEKVAKAAGPRRVGRLGASGRRGSTPAIVSGVDAGAVHLAVVALADLAAGDRCEQRHENHGDQRNDAGGGGVALFHGDARPV